jgi:hypothetical protein
MDKSFKDSLPPELIHHATALCGRDGEEWIEGLEDVVRSLEKRWSITALKPFAAGEYNYVAAAKRASGDLAVLKLAPPYKTVEIFAEAAYLRARDGNGAVKFFAEDRVAQSDAHRARLAGKEFDRVLQRRLVRFSRACDQSVESISPSTSDGYI